MRLCLPQLLAGAVLIPLAGCGDATGKPGPFGATWDGNAFYSQRLLRVAHELDKQPPAVKEAYARMAPVFPVDREQTVKHSESLRIRANPLWVMVNVKWETFPIEGEHRVVHAEVEALEYHSGTSCDGVRYTPYGDPDRMLDVIQLEIRCRYSSGPSYFRDGIQLTLNGTADPTQPVRYDGELYLRDEVPW
jgi:hypothetical protein